MLQSSPSKERKSLTLMFRKSPLKKSVSGPSSSDSTINMKPEAFLTNEPLFTKRQQILDEQKLSFPHSKSSSLQMTDNSPHSMKVSYRELRQQGVYSGHSNRSSISSMKRGVVEDLERRETESIQSLYSSNLSTKAILVKSHTPSERSDSPPFSIKELEFDELTIKENKGLPDFIPMNNEIFEPIQNEVIEKGQRRLNLSHESTSSKTQLGYAHSKNVHHDENEIKTPRPILKSSSQLLKLDEREEWEFNQYQDTISHVDLIERNVLQLSREVNEVRSILKEMFIKQQDVYLPFIVKIQSFFRGSLTRSKLRREIGFRSWTNKLKARKLNVLTFHHLLTDCEQIGLVQRSDLDIGYKKAYSACQRDQSNHSSNVSFTENMEMACIKIQSVYRGHMVRYRCEKYSVGYYAASLIQNLWRGYSIRKRYQDKIKLKWMEKVIQNQNRRIEELEKRQERMFQEMMIFFSSVHNQPSKH